MARSDEHWLTVTDAFQEAAIDSNCWYPALERLAAITGSTSGQLIGIGSNAAVPLYIITNSDPAGQRAFVDAGGGDPEINPRVKAGMMAPVLKAMAESDFITPEEYKRHPHYQEFARPWDIPFICLTPLERRSGLLVGLSVVRSQRDGHITRTQRAIFSAIAPHVRAAVRTKMALEDRGAAVLAGTLETLAFAAFVCDGTGQVRALTPAAEALVGSGRDLQLKLGRLHAAHSAESEAVNDAVAAALLRRLDSSMPSVHTVILRNSEPNAAPLVLDVIALPARHYEFSFAPRVLVVVRSSTGATDRRAAVLQTAYGLTPAETAIALQLSTGKTAAVIAANRNVTVGTVRLQIKTTLAKMGINRQIELVARLNQL